MRRKRFTSLASVVTLGMFAVTASAAESVQPAQNTDAQTASYAERVAALETELVSLRAWQEEVQGQPLPDAYDPYGSPLPEDGNYAEGGQYNDASGRQPSGLYAGAEVVWIKPHFNESLPIFTRDAADNESHQTFGFDHETTPRVWLGYTGCSGLGARVRYWRFDENGDDFSFESDGASTARVQAFDTANSNLFGTIDAFGAGEVVSATYNLELHVVDAEFTQRHQWGRTLLVAGCGLRHVDMNQRVFGEERDGAGALQDTLEHNHGFEGVGPLLSLEAWRAIGCCRGLAFYCNARGAVLFGDSHQVIINGGETESRFTDGVLPILEFGIGLEWMRRVPNLCGNVFVRGGWEGQTWFDAGSASHPSGEMGLEGLSLAAGISR